MGVVIIERNNADGSKTYRVRWNRRREDRPRQVDLGGWPEKKYAVVRRDKALTLLALGEDPSREVLDRRARNTIREVTETWLESEHVSAKTFARKQLVADQIIHRWGTKAPASLTKTDVQKWIDELIKAKKSEGTIKNYLHVLRPILRSADFDPMWMRGYKQLNIPGEGYEALDLPDRDRREAVRANLSPIRQLLFDIYEHGGLRTAEGCGLLWQQVNIDANGHPYLTQIGTKWVRKGGKPPRNVRHMPELDQPMWVPTRNGEAPDARVFPDENPSGVKFGRALRLAAEAAGVEPFTAKDLRHLHATRLSHYSAKHTLGLEGMAKRMGHSQAVFLKTYSDHPLPSPD